MQKPFSPSADRNKVPILQVLKGELYGKIKVLEIGSGTGQHGCYFAREMPDVIWQPSELKQNLWAVQSWVDHQHALNIRNPIELDVNKQPWPMVDAHCCFTCNTFHIVDNASIRSIFKGCQAILQGGGKLIVYGPFSVKGEHSSPSNARFDEQLRLTNPTSGVKDLHELDDIAMHFGFKTYRSLDMPHNNVVVVWEREAC